ncbi:MAG TPA: amino acid adenylation domain-containing protein, partial [Thermoanaerobaculia bacterium]|nr:amino acid adenylation domain-containing protein [Thermoanaerobaculia bacterium]
HMVPSTFVSLAALPLSPNGKVERRLLPAPEGERGPEDASYVAPRTPVEELVAGIWSEVLGVDRIGARDSFFDLGGHSLLATRVTSRLRRALGVDVPLKTLFEAPTVAELAAVLEKAGRQGRRPEPPLRPVPRKGALPLSFAQQRLWFLDQLEPGSALYNMPSAFLLEGGLDARALASACHRIAGRHEVLRTVFPSVNGEPVQVIRAAGEGSLPLVDLSGLAPEIRERVARDLVRQEAHRPFDLARGPLLRGLLVRLAGDRHVLSVSLHHIVSDGGSIEIFERELVALYGAAAAGRPSPLPDLPLQYADFAVWQREWLSGEALESEIGYWRERLAGAPPVLDLPTDRPRPKELGQRGASRSLELPESLSRSLGALARAETATPFMVLLAAFSALLARATGRTDVLLGTPIAGRSRLETEPLIGLFVNTLVLRTDLSGDPEVRELLRRARETALGAHAHQDLPFERLVEELEPQRSLAHTPLFQVLLVQAPRRESPGLPGLAVLPFGAGSGTAKFDLTLAVSEGGPGLGLALEYRTDLFDATTADRLLAHLAVLLEGVAEAPGRRLSELPVLTPPERAQVVSEWNATGLAVPWEETLAGLFEAQVERTPGATALVAGDLRWSYRELDREAGRLARRLQSLGVGPEMRVGVHLDRSPELIVALLAVLKAGGAYVPLDPGYPEERLAFLVADSAAAVILSRGDRVERLAAIAPGTPAVCLDREPSAGEESGGAGRRARSGHLAYLIYTSGSTGRPKGVAIEHRSAVAMVSWALAAFAADDLAGMLASTSINFDLSVFELFVPLSRGGKVILAGSALDLPSLPAAGEVTFVNTVPSAMAELVRTGGLPPSVTAVGLAGEPLPRSLVQQLYRQGTVRKVYNLYGPSEGTTYSSWARLDPEDGRPPSIGRPVANTEIHLLDAGFSPVGIGSPGELYVGGAGVARGYLGRPELTAERFLPDPFSGRPGARLYRTGDLARWRRDGEIDFLGRADFQVKVRGFRIELGEIEAVLDRHPGVRETVAVLADGPVEGDKRLVAYVALADPSLSAAGLRSFLAERLPDHMVPTVWVLLEALPRTPNGKVDRKALPAPDAAAGPEAASIPPRNPVEEVLAGIWAEVLGRDQVGVTDDFFALGGHSLLATRVIAQVKAAFRVEMGLQSLFREPTVERMAASLLAAPGERERIERTAQLLLELAATPDEEIGTLLGEDPAAAGERHR